MSRLVSLELESQVAPTELKRIPMSYDQWLNWDYEGGLTEWVDGEVYTYMPASFLHQQIVEFLDRLLGMFVSLRRLGIVKTAPYPMRAAPNSSGREPALLFIGQENAARAKANELDGPADLVIEVISNDSVVRDRDEKFYEYERGGVREYWILDPRPDRLRADFYVLDERGRYQPIPIGADGIYRPTVVSDFWIRVDWLWDETKIH
ncbi:MAG TPA: Uma2 family endonuclease [Anaerolineae bacterium]|nr:Uma2 family endonuclease [Anaerolineae bacterium]